MNHPLGIRKWRGDIQLERVRLTPTGRHAGGFGESVISTHTRNRGRRRREAEAGGGAGKYATKINGSLKVGSRKNNNDNGNTINFSSTITSKWEKNEQ